MVRSPLIGIFDAAVVSFGLPRILVAAGGTEEGVGFGVGDESRSRTMEP